MEVLKLIMLLLVASGLSVFGQWLGFKAGRALRKKFGWGENEKQEKENE